MVIPVTGGFPVDVSWEDCCFSLRDVDICAASFGVEESVARV